MGNNIYLYAYGAWGSVVFKASGTSRMVPGSITGDFLCGSFQQNHVS